MLYSPVEKIEHILKNYNITSFNYCKYFYNFRINITNLHNGSYCLVICDLPMVNMLQYNTPNTIINTQYTNMLPVTTISNINPMLKILSSALFNSQSTINNYVNEYFYRYNCLQFDSTTFGSEYFQFMQQSDIVTLLNVNGIYNNISAVYGHFILTSDNIIRNIYKPIDVIAENVEDVYFSDFYIYDKNGNYFNAFFVIYKKYGSSDIWLTYNNSFMQNIEITDIVTVNITTIFGSEQGTIESDIADITKYNSKYFIVFNLLSFGIFVNTPTGIIRYIPHIFDRNYFNIIINKMKIVQNRIIQNSFICNSNAIQYNYTYNDIIVNGMVTTSHITDLIHDIGNIIIQNTTNYSNLYNNIYNISSDAEYYNQAIFDIAVDIDDISVPIFIKSKVM